MNRGLISRADDAQLEFVENRPFLFSSTVIYASGVNPLEGSIGQSTFLSEDAYLVGLGVVKTLTGFELNLHGNSIPPVSIVEKKEEWGIKVIEGYLLPTHRISSSPVNQANVGVQVLDENIDRFRILGDAEDLIYNLIRGPDSVVASENDRSLIFRGVRSRAVDASSIREFRRPEAGALRSPHILPFGAGFSVLSSRYDESTEAEPDCSSCR